MHKKLLPALCALAIWVTLSQNARAAESELELLRERVRVLTEGYESQQRLIQKLEARLSEVELQQRGRGPAGGPVIAQAAQQRGAEKPAATAQGGADAVVKETPRSKTTETIVQQEHALFDRKFTLETGLTYTRYDRRQLVLSGFLALDAIFLGQISLDQTKSNAWTFDVTGRYGLTDRLSFDVNAPFIYRSNQFISGGAGGAASALSDATITTGPKLGDMSIGAYYQLVKETGAVPDIVGNVRLKFPTGEHPYGVKTKQPDPTNNNLTVPETLPTGNGVTTLSVGASFLKTADPIVLFANAGYNHNFKRHFSDITSAPGLTQPGDIKLGDSFQWGAGMALALNERTSMSLSFSQLLSKASRTRPDGQGWQKVVGSEANAGTFNAGLTYSLSERMSMVGTVGIGLTPDAPDFSVGIKFPYTF